MATLIIRLSGSLQSWGVDDRFRIRATDDKPSFSAVTGIIAAALGMDRTEPLDRFQGLRFGVRKDRQGQLLRDYQTRLVDRYKKSPKNTVSSRWYLADAAFTVGLESDNRDELESYAEALEHPHYQLYLGRRSCMPDEPIRGIVTDLPLFDALKQAPLEDGDDGTVIIMDSTDGVGETVMDRPGSFDTRARYWTPRIVHETVIQQPASKDPQDNDGDDWFATLDNIERNRS